MTNSCSSCRAALVPGALACPQCGVPAFQVGMSAPGVRELVVVEGGAAGTRITPPAEGVEILLGRHDLTRAPPWVVDVDLGRLLGLSAGEPPPVSRDQAALCTRAGELLVTPHGQAPTLKRDQGSPSFTPLSVGTAYPLKPGDRLAFGHGGRVLVLEAH